MMKRMDVVPFLNSGRLAALCLALGLAAAAPAAAQGVDPSRSRVASIALDGSALPGGLVADGGDEPTVWFTAANRSAVGEVDAASRTVGYIALGHGAKPRGIARCPNGNLYALDPALNVIHEITPATEEVRRFPMPGGQSADLHSAVCTQSNVLLFTGYNGWVGRLDTAMGQVTLSEALGGRGPAQMAISPSGAVYFVSYASNTIVRLDAASLKQDAFALPQGVEGPKGIAIDAGGRVWVSAFRSARLARFDPRRRAWDAWLLGDGARPHAVAVEASGSVLVTDVGRDRLLRFDPAAGVGVTVAQLSDKGQARSMARLGDRLWITESAVDRIAVVDLSPAPSN